MYDLYDVVEKLAERIGLNTGKKPKAEHHLEGRNFPFYTRNPERVKFLDDFNEIVGIIARISLGKKPLLDNIRENHLANVKKRLELGNGIIEEEIEGLFGVNFNTMKNTILLQYFPVSMGNKSQKDESRGKELLGYYITKLLRLDENEEWQQYISKGEVTDLYEAVYVECLPEINEIEERKDVFHFFEQEALIENFNQDLKQLMKNEKFFLNNVGLLISYYFFYYTLQQTYLLAQPIRQPHKLWFSYDKERISAAREAVQNGYQVFNDASRELLINNDLLDYLNILSESKRYQTFAEIVDSKDNYSILGPNLMIFNSQLAKALGEEYNSAMDIQIQIKQLQRYLRVNVSVETATRYRKSFDEFSGLNFIKSRGRLGYVLNATQEFILLFVGVIIGNEEKMLLKKLFKEFERRGIYFDKQSRKEITSFFEDVNILEKLSDSGDAQYVKSIL